MSVAILQFPGTNCEKDMQYAYNFLGIASEVIWHKQESLPLDCALVVVPGGFSYGDYLRSGAIARYSPIMRAVTEFARNGGFVLGICNGFQILCESGLLPGALKRNVGLHFISRLESLRVVATDNAFLQDYVPNSLVYLPIAHADGSYFIEDYLLDELEHNHQILLRYETNPNGSISSIAGICNQSKNIFGLMPHPERAIESLLGSTDGLKMLDSIYKNALKHKQIR
ncbi:phosphoribosylformylglycinamidine synthase subunit PurQ [Helicobacter sp. 10-6591]|uniref:phosphoribosylformylglycinamidine synthase subunit PurQ n=1 Tax=Helicobacter sp. 10-6591 TaxID=2004998 RepID=UPI000DCDB772|nr:phosphoribosylformylglycinamidine synthase subunit PurQ [Helicobacter sp. 10-6591]RAX56259.1 phosphoribosylformylglycinamidine synthase I [Helicobacter sp. 10-6591]